MAIREQVTIEVDVEGEGLKKLTVDAKALKRALKGVEHESDDAGKSLGSTVELAEKMRGALGPLGDALGDVTGFFADTQDSLEGFNTKQVAATMGFVAAAAALVSLGSAVSDVIVNLDDYADQIDRLEGRGIIGQSEIEALKKANAAVSELGSEFGALFITIAASVAPMVEDFSRGLIAVLGFVQGGFDGAAERVAHFNEALREAKNTALDVGKESQQVAQDIAAMPEALASALPAMVQSFQKSLREVGAETTAEVVDVFTISRESMEGMLKASGETVAAIGTIFDQVMQKRIDGEKKGSAEQRKLMKQQFAANKAFALVQATINTALAVMNAMTIQPAYLGIIMAAAAAATGAAQIAVIASQKPPSFHRGGLLPDEQRSFGGAAITRQNETGVVFTAQGQRSFTDAINAMNRGDHSGQGGITVMLDSQPIRGVVTQMGQADPSYGHRRRF